ncbi:peptidylprolyl isomerase [Methylophilus medardicus]|uniref:Chaperone SurA n=1 Tax=Methylophilus medardicus TaxID=2588534 RepID=A0A5B8CXR6_9PROT|nr:peptidylprolyl isomerase [Methylophilus medardicus]QDC45385.1 molecular chaperone SurA [Methylophilus medardicus]QDC50392.1 molecular chaperone SurA [Methylophilus medardicus]QDC54097.1 molecular chaperone SurA [Methylophilus medardicus]
MVMAISASPSPALWAAEKKSIEKMDRIIAVVDQSVITEREMLNRMASVKAQMIKKGVDVPPDDVLQKQILERLIVDSLQLQLAAQTGIKVEDAQLDKTIERIAEQNNLTLPAFKKALEEDGTQFYKFREDIRNDIILARLRERDVDNKVNISEAEIDNYLTTQEKEGDLDEFNISQILIRLPEDSAPEDIQKARARTEQITKALAEGMSFEKVSANFSDAPNALDGGGLGWRSGQQMPAQFLELVKTLQPGGVSRPIRSGTGVHILKLNDRRAGASTLIVEQTHVRHILLKPNEVLSDKEAKQKIEGIKERIDHGTPFQDMARQYSDDGSASSGGDLGWISPGDTVPVFEKTMAELAVNEVSMPVRSQFGWHLIQVLERRKQDMSKESKRLKARQEIRARKAEESYNDWIHELRDKAFVEMRLEDKF